MIHSEKLEETKLWQIYQEKVDLDKKRSDWVKEKCMRRQQNI